MISNNRRIAKNTLMLYFRMILITGVSLYTIRVVLNVLGIDDFGIYSVIVGIVSLCSFLSGSMASATQRFFAFALGKNDLNALKTTFTVNWILYAVIAIVAWIAMETVGLWFVNEHLQVPEERFSAASTLYHLSIFTLIAGVFTSPFMAIMIAHEDMHIYAFASITEALMKLGAAILLIYLPGDKLELYGILLLVASVFTSAIYIGFCVWKYEECQFKDFYWDKTLLWEILSFTGWTLFGQLSTVVRSHAVTVLLNQTFNPAVVAARTIAVNVAIQTNTFASNFNVGLYPSIIKSYAADERDEMFSYVFNGSKMTFFLMWIFTLPLFLQMEVILNLWLREPPPDAIWFTRLALLEALVLSVSLPLATAARAPGKMRLYELTLGIMQIMIFPISWLVLKLGGAAYSVFVVAIAVNLLMFIVRLVIVRALVGISVGDFFRKVGVPVSGAVLFSSLPSITVANLLPAGLVFSVLSIALSMMFSLVCIYSFGFDKKWRKKIRNEILSRMPRWNFSS